MEDKRPGVREATLEEVKFKEKKKKRERELERKHAIARAVKLRENRET